MPKEGRRLPCYVMRLGAVLGDKCAIPLESGPDLWDSAGGTPMDAPAGEIARISVEASDGGKDRTNRLLVAHRVTSSCGYIRRERVQPPSVMRLLSAARVERRS